jgi:predicted O-methyltransferase YrrM
MLLKLDDAPPIRPKSKARRTVGFVKPYVVGAASAAYLFSVGWLRKKHRAAIVDLSSRFGYQHNSRVARELPEIAVDDVASTQTLIELHEPQAQDGNVSELELILLARLVRSTQPSDIFEFGTFDGRTTLNLAANAAANARVYTIDLPRESIEAARGIDPHEIQFADKPVSGTRFIGTDLESRITQLYGDSGSFDFSGMYASIDFVFVDASHAYEYVINDSLHALRMLRGGHGTIVWHDYGRWDGVTAALNELRSRHWSFRNLQSIAGTTLALTTV